MWKLMRVLLLLATVLTLSTGVNFAVPAQAADEVTVVSDSHQSKFPNEIIFDLRARSAKEIKNVTLYYKFSSGTANSYARPEFTPGLEISARYSFDSQKSYIPPGTDVTYYWQLDDAEGNQTRTQPITFTYEDSRFKWQSASEGKTSMHYYDNESQARSLLGEAVEAVRRQSADLRVDYTRPLKIYVYASRSDMIDALPKKSATFDAATTTLGVRLSPEVLLLLGDQSGVRETMYHEIMHMVVSEAAEGPYSDVPTWLNEGLAMWAQGEMTPEYQNEINRAIRANRLLSIRSLTSFPGDPSLVNLSYGESWSIVSYMIDTYGTDKMAELMAVYKEGSTTDKALIKVYGFNIDELDARWRASIGAPAVQQGGTQGRATQPQGVPTLTPFGSQPQGASSDSRGPLLAGAGGVVVVVAAGTIIFLRRRKAA